MHTGKAPTIADVAREAGVSRFTVSVVLNGARSNTRVSEATRQRILTIGKSLRYHANASARNLARQCTSTIGVLFGVVDSTAALSDNYASVIFDGIVAQAASRHYDVLLYTEPWRAGLPFSNRFRDRRTDGVVIVAPLTDSDMLDDLAAVGNLPVVAISSSPVQSEPLGIPSIDVDNAFGIRLAVEHLVSLGHRRIVHMMGNGNVYSVTARREAFLDSLQTSGLPATNDSLILCTYDAGTVPETLRRLFRSAEPPTAIVAGNDNIAIAVLRTAREEGIRIPEQLSVVGFDDIPASAQVTPALTTIRQPLRAIAVAATESLIDRIERAGAAAATDTEPVPDESVPRLLTPELIIRGTTAPANGLYERISLKSDRVLLVSGDNAPQSERNEPNETHRCTVQQ